MTLARVLVLVISIIKIGGAALFFLNGDELRRTRLRRIIGTLLAPMFIVGTFMAQLQIGAIERHHTVPSDMIILWVAILDNGVATALGIFLAWRIERPNGGARSN